jgi:hypothetical protein
MKSDFYTYAYLREDGTPYYIGKGQGKRAFEKHLFVGVPSKNRVLFLKTGMTEAEAFRHEVYMISIFGRKDNGTGILWNFTDGGEGLSGRVVSEDTKKKQKERATGIKPSQETRKKLRQAKLGKNNPNFGKSTPPEVRAKMSAAAKGKTRSPETRAKMSAAMKKIRAEKFWS